jgi:hypothetical protein
MLRTALALLSTLQLGTRVKETVERSLRQAALIAVAAFFLLAAFVFGLIAAYHVLVSIYQFTPAEAAAIVAGALLLVGVLILAIASQTGKPPRRRAQAPMTAAMSGGVGMIDQTADAAVKQIGPLNLVAIAFLAGLFAGRR